MSTPVQLEQSVDPTGALSSLDLAQQDISNIMDQFNSLQDQLNGGNITQNSQNIIVFDDTTNRVLIGYQSVLQQWGLFVSQPGIDVTQATADQLIFNSEQDVFKIILTDTFTVEYSHNNYNTGTSGQNLIGSAFITYSDLGFTPIVIVSEYNAGGASPVSDGTIQSIPFLLQSSALFRTYQLSASSDSLSLGLVDNYWNNSGIPIDAETFSLNYIYYLLQESAAT